MDMISIIGIILGILGVIIGIYYGRRSKSVENAFTRYVDFENEIVRLRKEKLDNIEKIQRLELMKSDIYRNKYQPKSNNFKPGDHVKLVKPLRNRSWISEHAKIGMTGIVVDYGPGVYEYTVYWSEADYEGQPMDEYGNKWRTFYVNTDEIERIN
jgi:hypothetical protein